MAVWYEIGGAGSVGEEVRCRIRQKALPRMFRSLERDQENIGSVSRRKQVQKIPNFGGKVVTSLLLYMVQLMAGHKRDI